MTDFKVEKLSLFRVAWEALVWILPFKKEPFRKVSLGKDCECKPAKKE